MRYDITIDFERRNPTDGQIQRSTRSYSYNCLSEAHAKAQAIEDYVKNEPTAIRRFNIRVKKHTDPML